MGGLDICAAHQSEFDPEETFTLCGGVVVIIVFSSTFCHIGAMRECASLISKAINIGWIVCSFIFPERLRRLGIM